MNRYILLTIATAATCLMAGCQREVILPDNTGSNKLTIIAQLEGAADTKASVDEVAVLKWHRDDILSVVNLEDGEILGTLWSDFPEGVDASTKATFSGILENGKSIEPGTKLAFIYPAFDGSVTNIKDATMNFSDPSSNGIPKFCATAIYYQHKNDEIIDEAEVTFKLQSSLLSLSLAGLEGSTSYNRVIITNIGTSLSFSCEGGELVVNSHLGTIGLNGTNTNDGGTIYYHNIGVAPASDVNAREVFVYDLGSREVSRVSQMSTDDIYAGKSYKAFVAGFEEVTDETVIYSSGVFDGHEYVDLGLPSGTLWASANVGAVVPTDAGGIYQGSHFVGDKDYHWSDSWKLPSKEQFEELTAYCTFVKDTEHRYYKVVSKINGCSIVLPFTGNDNTIYYWTSTYDASNVTTLFYGEQQFMNRPWNYNYISKRAVYAGGDFPMIFTSDFGARSYTVNCASDVKWAVSADEDWLSVSPASGSGKTDINIYVQNNMAADRTGRVTIIFIAEDGTTTQRVVSVSQKGEGLSPSVTE
ncbi:MAG: BACON domain-containing protein [Bacteroidales bacterium]|nr:BACON domain-containing protein [Bacteroidales bacterium]